MANLPEPSNPTFRHVYQIETGDLIQGGPNGTSNRPNKDPGGA